MQVDYTPAIVVGIGVFVLCAVVSTIQKRRKTKQDGGTPAKSQQNIDFGKTGRQIIVLSILVSVFSFFPGVGSLPALLGVAGVIFGIIMLFYGNRNYDNKPVVLNLKSISMMALSFLVIVGILAVAVSMVSANGGGNGGGKTVTCGYCHKSYSITSSSGKSIENSGLCDSCFHIVMTHRDD